MLLQPTRPLNPSEQSERNLVLTVYFLYTMVSITGIFGPIIGFVIAYRQKKKARTELGKSHFKKQLRVALYSFGGIILGLFLAFLASLVVFYADLDESYDFMIFIGIGISLLAVLWFFVVSLIGIGTALGGHHA